MTFRPRLTFSSEPSSPERLLRRLNVLPQASASRKSDVIQNPGFFRTLEQIGIGSNSLVYRCLYTPTNTPFAQKIIPIISPELVSIAEREITTLQTLSHPAILPYFCFFISPHSKTVSIILELMTKGSLADLANIPLPEEFVSYIARQLLSAVIYIHDLKGITHRDIKPANILINDKGEVKLADFGISGLMGVAENIKRSDDKISPTIETLVSAKTFPLHPLDPLSLNCTKKFVFDKSANLFESQTGMLSENFSDESKRRSLGEPKGCEERRRKGRGRVGSPRYQAPEVLAGRDVRFESDIWSLGVTLAEVALGKFPMELGKDESVFEVLERIEKTDNFEFTGNASAEFKDLIGRMIVKEPEKREPAVKLLTHTFIVRYKDIGPALFSHFINSVSNKEKN